MCVIFIFPFYKVYCANFQVFFHPSFQLFILISHQYQATSYNHFIIRLRFEISFCYCFEFLCPKTFAGLLKMCRSLLFFIDYRIHLKYFLSLLKLVVWMYILQGFYLLLSFVNLAIFALFFLESYYFDLKNLLYLNFYDSLTALFLLLLISLLFVTPVRYKFSQLILNKLLWSFSWSLCYRVSTVSSCSDVNNVNYLLIRICISLCYTDFSFLIDKEDDLQFMISFLKKIDC
jgi:hypothetical protein